MKFYFIPLFLFFMLPFFSIAQNNDTENHSSELTIVFDAGLLLGHSESYYPATFSSHISFLKNFNKRIWLGAGSGAEVIGKTFVPVFADLRISPFKSKPFYIYNKLGWTFCANKNYSDGTEDNYYYNIYPHPLNENINTTGGVMNEIGFGILFQRNDWKTSLSMGYNYKKTNDKIKNSTKTYENTFNRLAFRVGFWF